jgi:hypothetical protein
MKLHFSDLAVSGPAGSHDVSVARGCVALTVPGDFDRDVSAEGELRDSG